jgi:hypothetical protein
LNHSRLDPNQGPNAAADQRAQAQAAAKAKRDEEERFFSRMNPAEQRQAYLDKVN